jgi:hypothetical protein
MPKRVIKTKNRESLNQMNENGNKILHGVKQNLLK